MSKRDQIRLAFLLDKNSSGKITRQEASELGVMLKEIDRKSREMLERVVAQAERRSDTELIKGRNGHHRNPKPATLRRRVSNPTSTT